MIWLAINETIVSLETDFKTASSVSDSDMAKLESLSLSKPCILSIIYDNETYYTSNYCLLPNGGYWRYSIYISQYGSFGSTAYSVNIGVAKNKACATRPF